MKLQRTALFFLAAGALISMAPVARASVIATTKGIGADAEVRDHQSTTNFGASTELATRIIDNIQGPLGSGDGNDRFSAMYLKFDLAGETALPGLGTFVRLTFRNNNLTGNRLPDTQAPELTNRTGIAFYGLNRLHAGNTWDEATITYSNAPGLQGGGDFDNGTKDLDIAPDPDGSGPLFQTLIPLGVKLFPVLGTQNHLPVGGELKFTSPQLNAFVMSALPNVDPTLTIVACIVHDGKVPIND